LSEEKVERELPSTFKPKDLDERNQKVKRESQVAEVNEGLTKRSIDNKAG
jgi:hypothetical protein